MSKTKDALKILDRITGKSAEVRKNIANARINFEVAQMIYDARTKAGLSQRELAERVGSRQSVIAGLEDADYRATRFPCFNESGLPWVNNWNCALSQRT